MEGTSFKFRDTDLLAEVISVQPDTCPAKIKEGMETPQNQMRVEAIE